MSNFIDCNELANFLGVDGIDLFDNPGARCLFFLKKWRCGSISITFIEHENVFSISYRINDDDVFSAKVYDVSNIKRRDENIEIISSQMNNLIISKIDEKFLLTFFV